MRLGLDVAQTCAERAGCAWYADALARALVVAGGPGDSFELYHHFGDWINTATEHGTRIDSPRVTAPLFGTGETAGRDFWKEIAVGQRLPSDPDVVISCSFHAPRLTGARLVYTVHDLAFWTHPEFTTEHNRLLCQRELLQALAHAGAFLFVSDFTRREFEQLLPGWLGENRRPWALAPGASRFSATAAPRVFSAHTPWLAVGSLEPRKNHATLLDAYELYLGQSAQRRPLLLAGGAGWNSDALRRRIAEFHPTGLIRASGYVPEAELLRLYRESFALICPSWHEGFGLPLAEALSQGLPVLAGDRGSLPEVGGDAPVWFPPDDAPQLAEAMLRLENSPVDYAARSAAGLARASAHEWAATAKSVLEFCRSLLPT